MGSSSGLINIVVMTLFSSCFSFSGLCPQIPLEAWPLGPAGEVPSPRPPCCQLVKDFRAPHLFNEVYVCDYISVCDEVKTVTRHYLQPTHQLVGFLVIRLQLIPRISAVSPVSTVVPLVAVLSFTALKDAIEDYVCAS